MSEVQVPPRQASLALANSALTDEELLYIADAIYAAEAPHSPTARAAFARHKQKHLSADVAMRALRHRNIDAETGTKVVTQTIDLLA